jgi:hypothetical protein
MVVLVYVGYTRVFITPSQPYTPLLITPHLLLLDCDKSGQHRTDKCFSLLELVKDDGGSCDAFIGEYACSPHGFEQRTLARFVHMV